MIFDGLTQRRIVFCFMKGQYSQDCCRKYASQSSLQLHLKSQCGFISEANPLSAMSLVLGVAIIDVGLTKALKMQSSLPLCRDHTWI